MSDRPESKPTPQPRSSVLERVRYERDWDVVVIGGGATGLGVGLDSATRGLRTLVLEAEDFAKGTSSRSTKLIHGGVRYLAQGNLKLVREALREREILLRNAPSIVHPLGFVVPCRSYRDLARLGIGLKLYDVLAGSKNLKRSRIISRKDASRYLPTLRTDRLRGGVLYQDGQFDDAALAVSLARTIVERSGVVLNHAPVSRLLKSGGRTAGVVFRDAETNEELSVIAKVVINATGVFSDRLRLADSPAEKALVRPSQGVHILLDASFLPGDHALLVPETEDGRVLFAIPWQGKVLVGTTDTPVDSISLDPRPLDHEIDYLLRHAADYLSIAPRREDIRSTFAGLRPLIDPGKASKTSSISREHSVIVSASGLITVVGGKWTTYRKMAADALDVAIRSSDLPARRCVTDAIPLEDMSAARLVMFAERPDWNEPLLDGFPHRVGEVAIAARFEFARTLEDVLARRIRLLFLDARAAIQVAPRVARLLAAELGFDEHWASEQVRSFEALAAGYRPGAV